MTQKKAGILKSIDMKKISIYFFLVAAPFFGLAQPQTVDKVIGVVGKHIILQSDYYSTVQEFIKQGAVMNDSLRSKIYEELLFQKLLLAQADKDSVYVKDEQVDAELERRMGYYLNQFGSEENFYSFYGKSSQAFKEDLRDDVTDQLVAQQMQGKVLGDIKVTPQEVRNFYNAIPMDSLPLINSEVELGQLVKKPEVSGEAKQIALEKIQGLRKRILTEEGTTMTALATIYTDDPGSARTGGIYKGIMRGQFVPEFDAIAFKLKTNEISEVFETMFGYHFVKLLARRGDLIDVQHILITPKIDDKDMLLAKNRIDSLYAAISNKEISFCDATTRFSDDRETKNSCGAIVNNAAGSTRFEVEELAQIEQNLIFLLDKLQVGEITKPTVYQTSDSKQAYRIIYLKSRTLPHVANLKDDYQRIQNMTINSKQKKIASDWIAKKAKNMYIKVDPEFRNGKFEYNWNFPKDMK
ncbi:MAG: parvulin-like peptidyl-prolyl isomerase [Bacteroidetes bacterium]|jgi:peptidyl-prolyl cis-trans isomerase SurA|nr:parvulin-like peptidyl-prolyl isomerase [Bacteroidota bacterium]